jgi:hypothetical protein
MPAGGGGIAKRGEGISRASKKEWFDGKFLGGCADDRGVTIFFSLLLDHLIRHFGRTAGFGLFGFFFSSALLLPCCYLELITPKAALIEVIVASVWMIAASLVLMVLRGEEEEE